MPSFEPVEAVVRALTVLRIVNALGSASLKQIHQESRLHRSTILRMLETLMHERYVVRDSGDGTYAPTGKTLLLSSGFEGNTRIAKIAGPYLHELRQQIGWPSDLAILDGDVMVVLVTSREFNVVALNYKAGSRPPVLPSSLGRAYLAFCDPETRQKLVARLSAGRRAGGAQYGKAVAPKKIEQMLATVRKKGYATPDPDFNRWSGAGLATGFSVPVFKDGVAFASLSVAFLESALTMEQAVKALLPRLQETAAQLGEAIAQEY